MGSRHSVLASRCCPQQRFSRGYYEECEVVDNASLEADPVPAGTDSISPTITNRKVLCEATTLDGISTNSPLDEDTTTGSSIIESHESNPNLQYTNELTNAIENNSLDVKVLGQSRYNESYFCNVLRVEEIRKGVIELDFDVYGDGSLGKLQNPLDSRLGVKKAVSVTFEVRDMSSHVKGTLVFHYSPAHDHIARFTFGSLGYSTVELQVKPAYGIAELQVKPASNSLDVEVLGQSRYNESYFCNVLRVEEIRKGVIELDFDVYGDGSLGKLQNPLDSRLGIMKPESVAFEVEDMSSHMKGTLVFHYSPTHDRMTRFIFGSFGYSATEHWVKPAP